MRAIVPGRRLGGGDEIAPSVGTRVVFCGALSTLVSVLGYYVGANLAMLFSSLGNPLNFERSYLVILPVAACLSIGWWTGRLGFAALMSAVLESAVFAWVFRTNSVDLTEFRPIFGLLCITLIGPSLTFLGFFALSKLARHLLKPRPVEAGYALVGPLEDLSIPRQSSRAR